MNAAVISGRPRTSVDSTIVVGPAELRLRIVGVLGNACLEISEAESVDALTQTLSDPPPSVVVLALDESGAALSSSVGNVREYAPDAHLVLVFAAIQGWEVRAALAAGASGIVLSDELHAALHPCLLAVQAGQICVPQRHGRAIERPVLSSREKQILGLVVMGFVNSEIAGQLFLAESTVKSHLSSAFVKLEVHSRNEAVDLILNSERGLSMGVLALGGEPLELSSGRPR